MKSPLFLITAVACLAVTAPAQVRYATLTVDTTAPKPATVTNELTIAATETIEVVTFTGYPDHVELDVVKNGTTFSYTPGSSIGSWYRPLTMKGPATVRLIGNLADTIAFCALKITPESFPPDKTLIIPADTTGATVALECSMDLLSWQTATNGFYTGTNGAKFFRIRADRAP